MTLFPQTHIYTSGCIHKTHPPPYTQWGANWVSDAQSVQLLFNHWIGIHLTSSLSINYTVFVVCSVNYIKIVMFFTRFFEPKHIHLIMQHNYFVSETVQSFDKTTSLIRLFVPNNGVLNYHALRSCFATAHLCLPWPLAFCYLSRADTSHLRWSASGLAPLLSPIPPVMTPTITLQGSVPIYNRGVSSSCIVAVCQHFLLSFTDLFSTSCLCGESVVIPRVVL